MSEPIKRLNIRVSENTHYWLNLDAARHNRSLQEHLNRMLSARAEAVEAECGGKRLDIQPAE